MKPKLTLKEMIRLDNAGVRRFEIARRAGCDTTYVSRLLLAAGQPNLSGAGRRKIDIDRLRKLHAERLTDGEMAAMLGCTVSTVGNWRRRYGLAINAHEAAPPRTELTPREARALKMFENGKSYTDIGVKIGKSKNAVAGIINRARKVRDRMASA